MSLTPPEELKFINTYLQRANELQAKEPIVAYWCKYYAAKLALEKGGDQKSKEAKTYLLHLMDDIEKDRKAVGTNEAITNDVVGYAHIENFALRIFMNADNEDRNGNASKKTAKTFLAAAIFLELLKVFGDIDTEVQEKIRYAKWKATDIIKALKEGRVPVPGPPGGEPETPTFPSSEIPGSFSQQPTDYPPQQQPHSDQNQYQPFDPSASTQYPNFPPQNQGYPHQPTSPPASSFDPYNSNTAPNLPPRTPSFSTPPAPPARPITPVSSTPVSSARGFGSVSEAFAMDHKALQAAQKHSKFAISALQYDDVGTAVGELEKALALLRPMVGGRG
ncbi:hypothetical protein HK097_003815 [Rhizophlyctis rosea]|uniref:DUF605-domain-containing protein n=1 Tax=Rhizophlyctis rosea TaxID=64517 RepID=A0AAD5SEH7_9FUNG|nr:hypothetical protein HK097_003815 [Rhizophlyctis rosea]